MSRALKHLALLGITLPGAFFGYHIVAASSAGFASSEVLEPLPPTSLSELVSGVTGQRPPLADLSLLERNLFYVEQRYVERERIDLGLMFDTALDRVERSVPEVMFVRPSGGTRLRVSVGTFNTLLVIEPLDDFDALVRQLRRVASILDERLPASVDRAAVEYDLINGALSTLDPHSLLLPPVAAREMEVDNQGEFGGLGIEIHINEGRLTVKQPLEGTPAERAGMVAGDQIIRIEDESTVNMDLNDAVSRLRGEIGSPVHLLVKRKQKADPIAMTIVRDRIKLNPVEGQLLDGNVAYVRIKSFSGNVASDLESLLARLHREGRGRLKGLVLDLRGNPGGYLNQAVAVSDRFLEDGVIVATVEGSGRREEQRASRPGTESAYPVAVLVNGSSASASEIVAGALKNQGRAVIVGERTFGKGSVQHLYPNRDNSSLKLTVAKYLTPGDHSIQSIGIPPDVLIQPSVVRPAVGKSEDRNPIVSLYWREWVEREADLHHALGNAEQLGDPPSFSVRFLRDAVDGEEGGRKSAEDWEVSFARELLLNATGPSRLDVLRGAEPVVQSHQTREEERIRSAFSELGLRWDTGTNPEVLSVDVRLDLGSDGVLKAGQAEDVVLSVTNTSESELWQMSATTRSKNPWLDEREFYFGHFAPGETRTARQRVVLHEGYLDELADVTVQMRDPSHPDLGQWTTQVTTAGQGLPQFAYTVQFLDDGGGNGDGLPDAGETVALELTVENIGTGEARDAFVRARNKSGRSIDLRKGTLRLGTPLRPDGSVCSLEVDDDCRSILAPGATFTGRIEFDLRDLPEEGKWQLELGVGDNERYDHAAISRAGFYEFFRLEETLALVPGQAVDSRARRPPSIAVTRQPASSTTDAVLSGIVRDDGSVRDVIVYHGDQKVFYQGGDQDATVPFTVQPALTPGSNLLVILVRDDQGLTATRSVAVWRPVEEMSSADADVANVAP